MPEEEKTKLRLEIAHVLFIDIVGYSKLLIDEQSESMAELNQIVRTTDAVREAEVSGKLILLPTGDGMALVFTSSVEAPVECALQISQALRAQPSLPLRMGIHSGPVHQVEDVNKRTNIAGAGINIAQRVMDCGDAGHILLSKRVADDLAQYRQWQPYLHELGDCEVKHGVIVTLVNLYAEVVGNPAPPARVGGKKTRHRQPAGIGRAGLLGARWMQAAAALLLVAAALAFGFWHWRSATRPASRPGSADVFPEKSVAVLAFANLSDDKGSEYFSDGISEELLTVLQKIPGLRVAARTSAFSFKGKNATAQEIGQKLGVSHLVEGSVRTSGNTVRIAARLTRAASGEEIWSENYTRDLKDVFAVQTELAETIVGRLRGQLTGNAQDSGAKAAIQEQVQLAEKGGTKNVEAHQSYLQGRFYFGRASEKNTRAALVAYQRAVELDPGYALAWAGKGNAHIWVCAYSGEVDRAGFESNLAAGREATARALALEPELPEALAVREAIQANFDFDWKGAAETVGTALKLAPTNVDLVIAAATLADSLGDRPRAAALYREAVALDPVDAAARGYLAYYLAATGQFAEAQAEFPRVVELNPAAPWAHAGLGLAYLLEGKFEEAVTAAQGDSAEWASLLIVATARWAQNRIPESDAALTQLTQKYADTAAYQIADVHAYRREKDQSFEWLERARRQRDGGLSFTKVDVLLDNLHDDPRWQPFLHSVGFEDGPEK